MLCAAPTAMVQMNGITSQPFMRGRGTRQGCPLSLILFEIAIEPLAIAIRDNTGIVGIQRGGVDHKVSLYADNLLLYVSDPTKSPTAVLSLFSLLGPLMGYKINLHKTKLFPVNAEALDADCSDLPFNINSDSSLI